MASILKKLNCEMIDLNFQFDQKDFKVSAFREDVTGSKAAKNDFAFSYGARAKTRSEHAHMTLRLRGKNSLLSLTYHPDKIEEPDIREPYLEEVTTWLGGFFKRAKIKARLTAAFEYKRGCEPVVPLEYPLLSHSKLLEGALIAGYEINFPSDAFIHKAIISKREKAIVIFLYAWKDVEFANFDVHKAATVFSVHAQALVKKRKG